MKTLASLFLILFSVAALACPNCYDTVGDPKGLPWHLIIVGGFILLTYVPFYILFRAAKKFDPHN